MDPPDLLFLFVWFYVPSTIFQQHSDPNEARTHGLSVSSQALNHWATALP